MGKSAPLLRPLLLPITVAVLWLVTALAGHLLLSTGQPSVSQALSALVFPNRLPDRFSYLLDGPGFTVAAGISAVAVAAFAAMLLPAARRNGTERTSGTTPRGTAFLAVWACLILASVAGSAVLGAGVVVAEWPPARKIYIFDSVMPLLFSGAYWGVIWGWAPALLAASTGSLAASSGAAAQHRPAKHDGGAARPWYRPLAVFTAVSLTLLVMMPTLKTDPGADTVVEPEVVPTQEPVVYGAEPVGPSLSPADPGWCTGNEVLSTIGGWDAATGHRGARIVIQNTGDRTCTLQGYPDLAFEDTEGWAMGITAVHGGSFMTQDTAGGPVSLGPGQAASADIGWNGTAGAGMSRVGTLLVAPFAGTLRQELDVDIDLTEPGFLTVTQWTAAPAGA
ncbi:DUF4232 domain-containing protein [Arthrobacter citreus]|uniref:DUF4232 domain-containing protein n=1 Tax=Arthrobacter TaxID=1663 RepID=UPI0014784706|nr:DUF4232 domain-containing protein [Arthrobacter gandavensis]